MLKYQGRTNNIWCFTFLSMFFSIILNKFPIECVRSVLKLFPKNIKLSRGVFKGGLLGLSPPHGPVKSIVFRAFSCPNGCWAAPMKKKCKPPPLDEFLNTPLKLSKLKFFWQTTNPPPRSSPPPFQYSY